MFTENENYDKREILKNCKDITADEVFDYSTLRNLQRLQENKKLVDFTRTVVSSGKEACVFRGKYKTEITDKTTKFVQEYQELCNASVDVIIKIYKTKALTFKNKSIYMYEEKRFTNYQKSNIRKFINIWSEKEIRNLNRLIKAEIPCPKPLFHRENILIMEMVKNQELIAPRLVDCTGVNWNELYEESISLLHRLYNRAHLVHADFSAYNLLLSSNRLYVIDVGQAIDTQSSNSLYFLIQDIQTITQFFKHKKVHTRDTGAVFSSITQLEIPKYIKNSELRKEYFIPRNLNEIANIEDVELFERKPNESSCMDIDSTRRKEINTETKVHENLLFNRKKFIEQVNGSEIQKKLANKARVKEIKKMNRERRFNKSLNKK